jgi:hypothetical protein
VAHCDRQGIATSSTHEKNARGSPAAHICSLLIQCRRTWQPFSAHFSPTLPAGRAVPTPMCWLPCYNRRVRARAHTHTRGAHTPDQIREDNMCCVAQVACARGGETSAEKQCNTACFVCLLCCQALATALPVAIDTEIPLSTRGAHGCVRAEHQLVLRSLLFTVCHACLIACPARDPSCFGPTLWSL